MTCREVIEQRLAPRLQGDGGWVEVAEEDGGRVTLIFRGECSKCLILDRCVSWMREEIRRETGEEVTLIPVRKKPFFWDNQ
ncbi:MAG: NifU family protein [Clostridia bacterium]|nr:NifU family protein [Clostridia bacterium]